MTKALISLFATLSVALAAGCRTEPKTTADANFPTRQTYNIPPKALLEKVKSLIGLPIASVRDGRLVTDWEPRTGATFGVAGVGREWQERTRYTITIAPAWDDPNNKSTIEVTEETQQRPQDNYEWGSQDPIKRPERAAEMAHKIDERLASAK
jgi:hypothetical protein